MISCGWNSLPRFVEIFRSFRCSSEARSCQKLIGFPDLQELVYRNAVELTHARWKSDVQLLIRALRPYLDVQPDASRSGRESAESNNAPPPAEPTRARVDTAVAVPFSHPDALQRICRELTSYIGPVAEVIVKRAARKCSTSEDLIAIVAREIEDETERARFLKASRT